MIFHCQHQNIITLHKELYNQHKIYNVQLKQSCQLFFEQTTLIE